MEIEIIKQKITVLRAKKVMLDFDLAVLYSVETRVLKQAVRRNLSRFPADFLFQLTHNEIDELVSQSVIPSKSKLGGATPFAFTEQGVAMLSSVLNSDKAVDVNISIMRAFVLLRQHLTDYKDLKEQIALLEKEMNIKFKDIYQALNYLLQKDKAVTEHEKRSRIGFKTEHEKK
jgi:hypothetical protein